MSTPITQAGNAASAFIRDVGVVILGELQESIRSRRFLVLMGLFVICAIGGTAIFAEIVLEFENNFALLMGSPLTEKPGVMLDELMRSAQGKRLVSKMVGDAEIAEQLVTAVPLALFYGWYLLALIPIGTALACTVTFAAPLANGSARYDLVRTTREAWCTGKFLGQYLLMLMGIFVGAFAVLVTGFFTFARFPVTTALVDLMTSCIMGTIVAVPYVAFAAAASLLFRNVAHAVGLCLVVLAIFAFAARLHKIPKLQGTPEWVWDALHSVLPKTYEMQLWGPASLSQLAAVFMLFAIGFAALLLSFARFRTRNA